MEESTSIIHDEIIEHGNITLKTLDPKQWKKLKKALVVSLPVGDGNIEVTIPTGFASNFKENFLSLVQAVCHRHHFYMITVTEQ